MSQTLFDVINGSIVMPIGVKAAVRTPNSMLGIIISSLQLRFVARTSARPGAENASSSCELERLHLLH